MLQGAWTCIKNWGKKIKPKKRGEGDKRYFKNIHPYLRLKLVRQVLGGKCCYPAGLQNVHPCFIGSRTPRDDFEKGRSCKCCSIRFQTRLKGCKFTYWLHLVYLYIARNSPLHLRKKPGHKKRKFTKIYFWNKILTFEEIQNKHVIYYIRVNHILCPPKLTKLLNKWQLSDITLIKIS